MSVQRYIAPITTSPQALLKFASHHIPRKRPCCWNNPKHSASITSTRFSTKRKLVTATAYRPLTLDTTPPPRNADVPESSIAGVFPQVNDIRPPHIDHEINTTPNFEPYKGLNKSITEREAQNTKSAANTTDAASSTESSTQPKRSRLRARKAAMSLTPTAIEHLRDLLAQPDPKLIRVGVKNRGCSGLAYHLEYVERPGAFDETVEQDGVKVLIDSKALFSIIGSEMDWIEDKLNQRFIFRNPNIKEQCGCGESFMV